MLLQWVRDHSVRTTILYSSSPSQSERVGVTYHNAIPLIIHNCFILANLIYERVIAV